MSESAAYLHSDELNGRKVVLAINQPLIAIESRGLALARRLREAQREHKARYLLLREGLAWVTERPALIVGAQVGGWEIEQQALVVWPLDGAVYCATISGGGYNLVVSDSETACSVEEAVARIEATDDEVLIVPGGLQATALEAAGYPANAGEGVVLSGERKYRTQSPVWTHTRHGLPHVGQASVLGLLAVVWLVWTFVGVQFFASDEEVARRMDPPTGQQRLSADLRELHRALRLTQPLLLYGLTSLAYAPEAVTVAGSVSVGQRRRLRELGAAMNSRTVLDRDRWRLTLAIPQREWADRPLRNIDGLVDQVAALGQEAGFRVRIGETSGGGAPVPIGPNRWRSRAWVETTLEFDGGGADTTGALIFLVTRLRGLEDRPAARLSSALIKLSADGGQEALLEIVVRGVRGERG